MAVRPCSSTSAGIGKVVLCLLLGLDLSFLRASALGSAGSCDGPWEKWAAQQDKCQADVRALEAKIHTSRDEQQATISKNREALKDVTAQWRKAHEEFKAGNEYLRPAALLSKHQEEPLPKCKCVLEDKCSCLPACQTLTQSCLANLEQVRQWGTNGNNRRSNLIKSQKHRIKAIPELMKRLKENDPKAGRYAVPQRVKK